jgi:hypothetical protein
MMVGRLLKLLPKLCGLELDTSDRFWSLIGKKYRELRGDAYDDPVDYTVITKAT